MENAFQLSSLFRAPSLFEDEGYKLLPFKLMRLSGTACILTNIAGEYITISDSDLHALVDNALLRSNPIYNELKARHFIYDGDPTISLELLATKYRTKQHGLSEFTGLHIFVVTLRCDHSCQYCQVSRVSEDKSAFDMSEETASKSIDLMFKSPSRYLKVEFQGGESLLNFDIIKYVVRETKRRNTDREIAFVIASNLANLTDEILEFAHENGIYFSCSLDGPAILHNKNRPRRNQDSYERTISGLQKIRAKLGSQSVSALMTTTASSLDCVESIVDEYLQQGFDSVFLRWISPFGFALKTAPRIGYDTERFLEFYKRGLDYILQLNLTGTPFQEEYTSIILKKILTPYATGYVDLQSPAGLGTSVLVYNYDGDVYASDEARMLAEMNDRTFRLGNVHENSYGELFWQTPVLDILLNTMTEGLPGCSDCALSPYCGTDPVFNHATQQDMHGHRPSSAFCRRNMEIIRHVISILECNDERSQILKGWVR